MEVTDTRVPIISALCQPYVKLFVAAFCDIVRAKIETAKPTKSLAKCAESVKIAMDPAIYPPMSCAVMKKVDTIETVISFFFAAELLFYCASKFRS